MTLSLRNIFILLYSFTLPLKESWNSIFLIIFLLICVYKNNHKIKKEIFRDILLILTMIFCLTSIALMIIHPIIEAETFKLNRLFFPVLLFGFGYLFKSNVINPPPLNQMINALFFGLSISGILRVLYGIKDFVLYQETFFFTRVQIPFESFISPNPIVYGLMLCLCSNYYLISFFNKKTTKTTLLIVFVLQALFLTSFYSTLGFFLALLTTFLLLIFYCKNQFKKQITFVAFVIAVSGLLFLLTPTGSYLLGLLDGDLSRVRNFSTSTEIISNIPAFGYGVGNEVSILQIHRSPSSWEFYKAYNAHNQFFELIIAGGWLYLIVFLTIIIYLIKSALKNNNLLLVSFVLSVFIVMFFESLFALHTGISFISFYFVYLKSIEND